MPDIDAIRKRWNQVLSFLDEPRQRLFAVGEALSAGYTRRGRHPEWRAIALAVAGRKWRMDENSVGGRVRRQAAAAKLWGAAVSVIWSKDCKREVSRLLLAGMQPPRHLGYSRATAHIRSLSSENSLAARRRALAGSRIGSR